MSYLLCVTLSPPERLCIKAGSCVKHLNVSLTVWAKSPDSVHKPQFLKKKESRSGSNRGPSAYQPSALPLGHTGSRRAIAKKAVLIHHLSDVFLTKNKTQNSFGDVLQLVKRRTSTPMTAGSIHRVSPRVNFQCRLLRCPYTPECNHMH